RPHQLDQRFQLAFLAGRLDRERLRRHVDDLGPEDVGRPHDLGPVLRLGVDANQHQLALDVVVLGEVADLDDVDELVELLRDLLDDELVAVDDDGHPRHRGIERLADGQDRKSTRLNSSHVSISYAVFCLKKKTKLRAHHSKTPRRMLKLNRRLFRASRFSREAGMWRIPWIFPMYRILRRVMISKGSSRAC